MGGWIFSCDTIIELKLDSISLEKDHLHMKNFVICETIKFIKFRLKNQLFEPSEFS